MQSAQNAAKALDGERRRAGGRLAVDHRRARHQVLAAAEAAARRAPADDVVAARRGPAPSAPACSARSTPSRTSRRAAASAAPRRCSARCCRSSRIIDICTGEVEEAGKARTRKKALEWLRDKVLADAGGRAPRGHARRRARHRRVPRPARAAATTATRSTVGHHRPGHRHPRRARASWASPDQVPVAPLGRAAGRRATAWTAADRVRRLLAAARGDRAGCSAAATGSTS